MLVISDLTFLKRENFFPIENQAGFFMCLFNQEVNSYVLVLTQLEFSSQIYYGSALQSF